MPTETDTFKKIHEVEIQQAKHTERLEQFDKSEGFLWATIEGFRKEMKELQLNINEKISDIKISIARNQIIIGFIQALLMAYLFHSILGEKPITDNKPKTENSSNKLARE